MEGAENTGQETLEGHAPVRSNSDSFHKRHHKSPEIHNFSSSDGSHHRKRRISKDGTERPDPEKDRSDNFVTEGRRRHSRNRSRPREQGEKEIPIVCMPLFTSYKLGDI